MKTMELDDTLKTQVNQYLNQELAGAELSNFEALLQKNEDLRQQIALYKELDDTMTAASTSEKDFEQIGHLLDGLGDKYIMAENNIQEEYTVKSKSLNENENPKGIIRYLIPIAAVAAAMLLIPIILPDSNLTMPELADKYDDEVYAVSSLRGSASDLKEGEGLYSTGKYSEALIKFNEYLENTVPNKQKEKVQLLKGNCEYQLGSYEKAVTTLKPIADSQTDRSSIAAWYLALAYLQLENETNAIKYLNLAAKNKAYEKNVTKLLKQLK